MLIDLFKRKRVNYLDLNGAIVAPEDFIKLYENNPNAIEESSIIPPKLGSPGFGSIYVKFFAPMYENEKNVSRFSETSENVSFITHLYGNYLKHSEKKSPEHTIKD